MRRKPLILFCLLAPLIFSLIVFLSYTGKKSTDFKPRDMAAAIIHNDRIFIFGGWEGEGSLLNDILISTDAVHYKQVIRHAPWEERCYFNVVPFKGNMFLLGGFVYKPPLNVLNDIWVSSNGLDWMLVTNNAPWDPREHYGSVVFKDQIFLLGGVTYGPPFKAFSDVWVSNNGHTWEKILDQAPWGPRRGFGCVVYKNKIWILGGLDSNHKSDNDVWSSSDGRKWDLVLKHAPWTERGNFRYAVFKTKIIVVGGATNTQRKNFEGVNDCWSTENGVNWNLETASAPWEGRGGSLMVTKQLKGNKTLYIIGGFTDTPQRKFFSDIWSTEDLKTWKFEGNMNVKPLKYSSFAPLKWGELVESIGGKKDAGSGTKLSNTQIKRIWKARPDVEQNVHAKKGGDSYEKTQTWWDKYGQKEMKDFFTTAADPASPSSSSPSKNPVTKLTKEQVK